MAVRARNRHSNHETILGIKLQHIQYDNPDDGDSVIIASVKYFKRGWIFGFNSARYLDTGDTNSYQIGGFSLYISMD